MTWRRWKELDNEFSRKYIQFPFLLLAASPLLSLECNFEGYSSSLISFLFMPLLPYLPRHRAVVPSLLFLWSALCVEPGLNAEMLLITAEYMCSVQECVATVHSCVFIHPPSLLPHFLHSWIIPRSDFFLLMWTFCLFFVFCGLWRMFHVGSRPHHHGGPRPDQSLSWLGYL